MKRFFEKCIYISIGALLAFVYLVGFGATCNITKKEKSNLPVANNNLNRELPPPLLAQQQSSLGTSLADVAERAIKVVVNISSTKVIRLSQDTPFGPFFEDPFFKFFFKGPWEIPRERVEKSLGSGVIVSSDGYILTNNHVIGDADEIKVQLPDKRIFTGKIIGKDPPSDLAVLKIEAKGLPTIPFGDSSKLRVGDIVLAIGNPFGLNETVTMGIVSAVGRANVGIIDYEDFIQTDAAINPGNSGGALVNMEAKLIGINTAIVSRTGGYQGIGFAIPSNMAKLVLDSLIKHGKVVRGWLGVVIQDLTPQLSKAMNLKVTGGAIVSEVEAGGPADKAGIKRGDVIVKFNNQKVEDVSHLRNMVALTPSGSKVKVEIIRDGETKTVEVIVGEKPENIALKGEKGRAPGELLSGIRVSELTPMLRQRYNIPDTIKGVVVEEVDPRSLAAQAGLQPGDVIMELNKQKIITILDFNKAASTTKDSVVMLIYRDGHTIFLAWSK